MFKFADYLNRAMAVDLSGRTIHVKEPSIEVNQKISDIEKDLTDENIVQKRIEVLKVLLDNNTEGIEIEESSLKQYPLRVVQDFISALTEYFGNPEQDPN